MAETIHVRGEGGAVFTMDLPLPEGIADRLAQGLLVQVSEDGPQGSGDGAPAPVSEKGESAPAPAPVDRPAQNAPKADWITHVVRRGLLSADDAATYTKADLIDLVS